MGRQCSKRRGGTGKGTGMDMCTSMGMGMMGNNTGMDVGTTTGMGNTTGQGWI